MKSHSLRLLLFSGLVCLLLGTALDAASTACPEQSGDTFRPGAVWPDDQGRHINAHGGGILHHGGVYYWFGEHKIEGTAGNVAHVGVHVYSSQTLTQWKDEGIALAVSTVPGHPLEKGCIIERPKVFFNAHTGKFVMWFHLELKGRGYSAAQSGVATADSPVGPYTYIHSVSPNAGAWPMNVPADRCQPLTQAERSLLKAARITGGPSGNDPWAGLIFRRDFSRGQMARDMTIFVDDDGSAYHVYASEENSTLQVSRLTPDGLNSSGKYVRILEGRFNEAPALFKARGKYWMISSGTTGWSPNPGRLSVADTIWGPWSELGNPFVGEGADTSFQSQSTFVLPAPGRPGAFIYMGDRWTPQNAIDGRYVWLPVLWEKDQPVLRWFDTWGLEMLGAKCAPR